MISSLFYFSLIFDIHYFFFFFFFFLGYDDKYYLLDFSRSMPPVEISEENFPGGHLYRLFRKNFVRDYPYPLCPDGFSGILLL